MNTLYTYGKLFHEGGGAFNNAKAGQNAEPVVTPEHSEGQAGIAKAGVSLFTPGPWRLGHKVPSLIVQDTPDKCGVVICEVDPEEKPFAQTHANRLLIAAAPDLYEVVRRYVAASIGGPHLLQAAKEALAKTGVPPRTEVSANV